MKLRLVAFLMALGLVGAGVGCEHTAGVCDCGQVEYGCGYGAHGYPKDPAPVAHQQVVWEAPASAPAKMPQAEGR